MMTDELLREPATLLPVVTLLFRRLVRGGEVVVHYGRTEYSLPVGFSKSDRRAVEVQIMAIHAIDIKSKRTYFTIVNSD